MKPPPLYLSSSTNSTSTVVFVMSAVFPSTRSPATPPRLYAPRIVVSTTAQSITVSVYAPLLPERPTSAPSFEKPVISAFLTVTFAIVTFP